MVMLVWLFALASGVANACLLKTPGPQAMAARAPAPLTGHAPAGTPAQLGASAGHHDDSDNAEESCLKACDDGAHTVPKVYSSVEHTDPGPAPLVATLWTVSQRVDSGPGRVHSSAIPVLGPPLRVCYSRLTL